MVDASQSLAPQLGLSAAGDDNINDNGCNAKFHAIFDSITGDWQEAYPPVLRDDPGFYNMRIVPAWRRLKADLEGGPVIVN